MRGRPSSWLMLMLLWLKPKAKYHGSATSKMCKSYLQKQIVVNFQRPKHYNKDKKVKIIKFIVK